MWITLANYISNIVFSYEPDSEAYDFSPMSLKFPESQHLLIWSIFQYSNISKSTLEIIRRKYASDFKKRLWKRDK